MNPTPGTVADQDLEALERYLDGDLSAGEAARLRERLSDEPALAAALGVVETERACRVAVWQSLGPTEEEAARAAARLESAARQFDRRRELRGRVLRLVRVGGAAAACAALFLAGWFARAGAVPTPAADATARLTPVRLLAADGTAGGEVYHVVMTDAAGDVVDMQKFDRLDEARQFAELVARMQAGQRTVQGSEVKLVSDEF